MIRIDMLLWILRYDSEVLLHRGGGGGLEGKKKENLPPTWTQEKKFGE